MTKLKIEIDHANFSYYNGLARMVGKSLKDVAYNGMIRELAYIEEQVFAAQRKMEEERDKAGTANTKRTSGEGKDDSSSPLADETASPVQDIGPEEGK